MEAMSSGSGQTFSYVNKPSNASCFRFGMDERMRGWGTAFEPTTLQNNASNYNYYVVSKGSRFDSIRQPKSIRFLVPSAENLDLFYNYKVT